MILDEKEPFFRRLQDRVVFSRGSVVSGPVDVVVRYSELEPDSILGEILGTNATYASLKPVFEDRSDPLCKMESVFPNGPARLSSSQVMLRSISERGWQEKEPANEPLDIVGQFECLDLLIDKRHPDRDFELTARSTTFYLDEDVVLWRPDGLEFGSGAFTLRGEEGQEITPGFECRFTMKGQPCLVYDGSRRPSSRRTLSSILPTVLCSTTKPAAEYSDDTFLVEARALVDEVLLLASLACRRVIRWHRYVVSGLHGLWTHVRSVQQHSGLSDRLEISALPVQLYRFHEFVRLAIPKLRDFRRQDLDLELPILYIVGSHETARIDERFSCAVLCLERLVDLHARAQGLDHIVPAKVFDQIRRRLRTELEASLAAVSEDAVGRSRAEAVAHMREKLTELNRLPFWALLSALLDAYGVQWTDLYPPGLSRPTLLSTRNEFIHSSKKPSYKRLTREAHRVQALCERVIFRMLGWEDPYSPPEYARQWLVRPEDEQGDAD